MKKILRQVVWLLFLVGMSIQTSQAEITRQRLTGGLNVHDIESQCNEGLRTSFLRLLREQQVGNAAMRLYHRLAGTTCKLEVYLEWDTVSLERNPSLKLVGLDDEGERMVLAEANPDPAPGDPDFRFQIEQGFFELFFLFNLSQVTGLYLESESTCPSGQVWSLCSEDCVMQEVCDERPNVCDGTACVEGGSSAGGSSPTGGGNRPGGTGAGEGGGAGATGGASGDGCMQNITAQPVPWSSTWLGLLLLAIGLYRLRRQHRV